MILAAFMLLQAAAPSPVATAPASPYLQQMRTLGVSEAGIAVLRRMAAPDPDAPAFAARRQALRDRLRAVAVQQPLDIDGFAGLLKAEAGAEGEARARVADKIAATLRALPPEDRGIFARVVLAQRAAAGPKAVKRPITRTPLPAVKSSLSAAAPKP